MEIKIEKLAVYLAKRDGWEMVLNETPLKEKCSIRYMAYYEQARAILNHINRNKELYFN